MQQLPQTTEENNITIPAGASMKPENGFEPKTINVKAGQIVTWNNMALSHTAHSSGICSFFTFATAVSNALFLVSSMSSMISLKLLFS